MNESQMTEPQEKSSDDLNIGSTLSYEAVKTQTKFLQGDVLTVIDASFSDERQCKAVKDLVNSAFAKRLKWLHELCYRSDRLSGVILDPGLSPEDRLEV